VTQHTSGIEPIFISVKHAADALALSTWAMYQLCDSGEVETRYKGSRRLVSVKSLREYAEQLPTERPQADAS